MSVYPAPTFTEYLSTFNPIYWEVETPAMTIDYANAHYLKYPVAQGLETLNGVINLGDTTFSGSNVPTCSATQPASTDSSTKMPTTAWVQSAITGASSTPIPTAKYYLYNLSNTLGIPAPYPTINFANIASKNYWDGITFRVEIIVQNNISSLSGSDTNGVSNFNSLFSSTMTVFPKAFITSTNPPIYFNNGIGGTNSNTAYAPVSSSMSPYVANGRPYYSSGIVNDSNIVACLQPSFVNNGTTAQLILNFPAIGWGGSTVLNYSMTWELINPNRYAKTDITTTNFTVNF